MSETIAQEQVARHIAALVAERASQAGFDPAEVRGDFNLVHSGVVDSMSFIEIVAAIETRFDCEIDFEGLDPSEFTTVDGLARQAVLGRKSS